MADLDVPTWWHLWNDVTAPGRVVTRQSMATEAYWLDQFGSQAYGLNGGAVPQPNPTYSEGLYQALVGVNQGLQYNPTGPDADIERAKRSALEKLLAGYTVDDKPAATQAEAVYGRAPDAAPYGIPPALVLLGLYFLLRRR